MTGVMLSIARSRLTIPTQLLFLTLNGCGLFFGIFYNVNTPDLYANNAHHKIGWIVTWVVTAQVAMSLLSVFSGRSKEEQNNAAPAETAAFLPVSIEAMAHHQQLHNVQGYKDNRWSGDSGQGTERASSSSHSRDLSPNDIPSRHQEYQQYQKPEPEDEEDADEQEVPQRWRPPRSTFIHKFLKRRVPGLFSQRALIVLEAVYDTVDRAILVLGFIAFFTGGVTYTGIFVRCGHPHKNY